MRLSLILSLLLSAQVAHAQAEAPPPGLSAPPLVGADAKPKPRRSAPKEDRSVVLGQGGKVTVHVPEGRLYSGEVLKLVPGELTLQLRTRQVVSVLLTDVEKLEVQERTWLRGTLIGGGIGGLIGLLGAGFICTLEASEGPVNVGECTGTGVLTVGAIGAGVGLVIGLANTTWSTVYDREKDGKLLLSVEPSNFLQRWASNVGHRGELGLSLGYGQDVGPRPAGGAPGGRFHTLLLLGSHFALGGELAFYPDIGDRHLVQLGGLARAGIQTGLARTSLLVAAGIVEHQATRKGGSVGVEVEMSPWKNGPPLALDVRYLTQFEGGFFAPRQSFLTVGLGSRVRF
jgi:hypothetical protein